MDKKMCVLLLIADKGKGKKGQWSYIVFKYLRDYGTKVWRRKIPVVVYNYKNQGNRNPVYCAKKVNGLER